MSQVIYKDRLGTDCNKWDGCEEKFGDEHLLPLWVADMDFEAPSCVKPVSYTHLTLPTTPYV